MQVINNREYYCTPQYVHSVPCKNDISIKLVRDNFYIHNWKQILTHMVMKSVRDNLHTVSDNIRRKKCFIHVVNGGKRYKLDISLYLRLRHTIRTARDDGK